MRFVMLLTLTGLLLFAMLYFGIRLKGFRLTNNVSWSEKGPGMAFDRFALAYTGLFSMASGNDDSGKGLSVEMAVQPDFPKYANFRFLLLMHSGEDSDQFLIGQWRSSLVIMVGDDFSNQRRQPKLYIQLDENDKRTHLLAIVSNPQGTRVYLDGELKQTSGALVLRYPGRDAQTRLVVGNSLSGMHPWEGKIFGLAFYTKEWNADDIRRHYQAWRANGNFSIFRGEPAPALCFRRGRRYRGP